jgi:hypothetical protein
MAFVFRKNECERAVFVRFDNAVQPPPGYSAVLVGGTTAYNMAETLALSWLEEGVARISNEYFLFDAIVLKHKEQTLFLAFMHDDDKNYSHIESLVFHQSYFYQFYDFAKTSDIYQFPGHYVLHQPLAIFTQVYNETTMLKIWESYYSKIVDPRHLYVIDHGSDNNPRDYLHRDVNVVKIPRGETDHRNIAHFCNQFHRFLLSNYKWVIHVDVDEILVHKSGTSSFLEELGKSSEKKIIKAAEAYNIVHNAVSEAPLDLARPITLQRTHIVPDRCEQKPVIASVPTTWGMGFHFVLEKDTLVEDSDLYVMHLPYMDIGLIAAKSSKWNDMKFSDACELHGKHTKTATATDQIARELGEKLASDGATTLPAWMSGLF